MTKRKYLGISERVLCKWKLLRGACNVYGDFFDDFEFDGNVNFDSGGNIVHLSFFKRIGARDRVVEPVYMP
jgi:hypothetical protein